MVGRLSLIIVLPFGTLGVYAAEPTGCTTVGSAARHGDGYLGAATLLRPGVMTVLSESRRAE